MRKRPIPGPQRPHFSENAGNAGTPERPTNTVRTMERKLPISESSDAVVVSAAGMSAITGSSLVIGPGDVVRLLEEMFPNRETRRAYRRGLLSLAHFLGVETPVEAIGALVAMGPVEAHVVAQQWLDSLGKLSAATRALRLASLKVGWRIAMTFGVVTWPLMVRGPKPTPLRDTRGPGVAGVRAMLEAARAHPSPLVAARDEALVLLLGVVGLRRREVARLCVGDFHRDSGRLAIVGKGRDDQEFVSLPAPVVSALGRYLAGRGEPAAAEPLFTSFGLPGTTRGSGLTDSGIYKAVRALGRRAGIAKTVSPHQLRHVAITAALDATHGDVRRVRAFSRHAKVDTVLRYDDRRRDVGGGVASLVAMEIALESPVPHAGLAPASEGSEAGTVMGVSVPRPPAAGVEGAACCEPVPGIAGPVSGEGDGRGRNVSTPEERDFIERSELPFEPPELRR